MPKIVYAQFDQQSLDREYSPSSRVEDIQHYLDAYADLSATARQEAARIGRCELDLHYGFAPRQRLDLFLPSSSGPHPLHIFVHGGFWQQLSKNESSFAATTFLRNSVAFAALGYTLAPKASISEIVDEVRCAITWLYNNAEQFDINRECICLSGHSAGAHLCAMMLATDWRSCGLPADIVKGVCAVSGVYDLEPVRKSYVNDVAAISERDLQRLSPARQQTLTSCPVSLAYGNNETSEFKRQTDEYREKLLADGSPVRFFELSGHNHFDVILDFCDPESWLTNEALRQTAICSAGTDSV